MLPRCLAGALLGAAGRRAPPSALQGGIGLLAFSSAPKPGAISDDDTSPMATSGVASTSPTPGPAPAGAGAAAAQTPLMRHLHAKIMVRAAPACSHCKPQRALHLDPLLRRKACARRGSRRARADARRAHLPGRVHERGAHVAAWRLLHEQGRVRLSRRLHHVPRDQPDVRGGTPRAPVERWWRRGIRAKAAHLHCVGRTRRWSARGWRTRGRRRWAAPPASRWWS